MKFKVEDRVRDLCGRTGTVEAIRWEDDNRQTLEICWDHPYAIDRTISNTVLEPADENAAINYPKIVITTEDSITTAKMYTNENITRSATALCSPVGELSLETSIKLAVEKLFVKAPNVGDVVRIVDKGESYTQFSTWVKKYAPNHAINYAYGHSPNANDLYTVIAKAPHLSANDMMLYFIRHEDNSCYLIGEKGIDVVKKKR